MNPMLDDRLLSAAKLVRAGAVLADIGTDHGYLPVFLLREGRISRAVLSDINEGPLSSADRHAKEAGLRHLVELVLTDGAKGLEGRGITDYSICGMGGELIAEIIAASAHLFDTGVRLILQPMTKQEHLRIRLGEMGFRTVAERYTIADGKYYLTLAAEYDGVIRPLSLADAYLGTSRIIESDKSAYIGYLEGKLAGLARARDGKRLGGAMADAEDELCRAIDDRLSQMKKST